MKLASKLGELQEIYMSQDPAGGKWSLAMIIVQLGASNIDKKKLRRLKNSTLKSRREGKYWGNERGDEYITHDNTPLKHTGRLLHSLKVVRGGFEIVEYGLTHQEKWTTNKGFTVNPRRFLPFTKNGNLNREAKQMTKELDKAFFDSVQNMMKKTS